MDIATLRLIWPTRNRIKHFLINRDFLLNTINTNRTVLLPPSPFQKLFIQVISAPFKKILRRKLSKASEKKFGDLWPKKILRKRSDRTDKSPILIFALTFADSMNWRKKLNWNDMIGILSWAAHSSMDMIKQILSLISCRQCLSIIFLTYLTECSMLIGAGMSWAQQAHQLIFRISAWIRLSWKNVDLTFYKKLAWLHSIQQDKEAGKGQYMQNNSSYQIPIS